MCPEDARTTKHLPSIINFNWTQHSHRYLDKLSSATCRKSQPTCYCMRELLVCCDMTLLNIYDDCTAKQIGCFNHRLVTLVADKLWLWESVYFGINWIRQPEKQVPNYKQPCSVHLTPQYRALQVACPVTISNRR